MQQSWSLFETLEDRRFMSVSASVLAGSLKKGTVEVFQTTGGGKSVSSSTQTVVGPTVINGVNATRIDTRQTVGSASILDSQFVGLDAAKGLVVYKTINDTVLPGLETDTTDTFAATQTVFPKLVTPGKVYSFKWSDLAVSVIKPINSQSMSTSTVTRTVKLVSAKLSTIKVPAGSFKCYVVQTVTTYKSGGGSSKTVQTQYIAPNVGVVKSTQTQSSVGSPSRTSVTLLKKFTKGKG